MSEETETNETEALASWPEITVNGEVVPSDLMAQEEQDITERYRQGGKDATPDEIRADAVENAIERILLRQAALSEIARLPARTIDKEFNKLLRTHGGAEAFYSRYGLTREDDDRIREDLAQRLRVNRYMDLITMNLAAPTEAEVEAFYERNASFFLEPEAVHAAHIMVAHRNGPPDQVMLMLLNLRKELLAGGNFQAVASRIAQDGSWDLGWIVRGQILPEFENVLFGLEVGEISEVFSTSTGQHLATVFDKRDARTLPLAEVRKGIEEELSNQAKNDRIGTIVDALRAEAAIERSE